MSKGWKYGVGLGIVIVLLFVANLLIGSVTIPVSDVFRILMGNEGEKASWSFIVWESRLPQALTALLCGSALAVCGLMLQTAFKNPLAGPSILVTTVFVGNAGTKRVGGRMVTPRGYREIPCER